MLTLQKKAYQELLEEIGQMSKKGKEKTNKEMFEKLLEKTTESGYLRKEKHYEAKVADSTKCRCEGARFAAEN